MVQFNALRHLGKISRTTGEYDSTLLEAIPRSDQTILTKNTLGSDHWTLYELSCRLSNGSLLTLVGDLRVPLRSPFIIESKSLKLYLFGLSKKIFPSILAFTRTVRRDLTYLLNSPVDLQIYTPAEWARKSARSYASLLKSSVNSLLKCVSLENFRSQCPVTHQPDWASLLIFSAAPAFSRAVCESLMEPLMDRAEFHEICVSRLYAALLNAFPEEALIVFGRFTRRGGIDINPLRSNVIDRMGNLPLPLQ